MESGAPRPPVSETALAHLGRFVVRSQRAAPVPLSHELLRSEDGARTPPAALMIRGGRGQGLRLRLYLTLLLRASSNPYIIRDLHPGLWAEALGVGGTTGQRRVNEALDWFVDQHLITLRRSGKHLPEVTLLSARGDGSDYVRPHDELGRLKYYVQVPLGLWRHGWIVGLPAGSLAVLLALLDNHSGRDEDPGTPSRRFVPTERRDTYGLSADTWTQAVKDLAEKRIITKTRIKMGDEYRWDRLRNAYVIHRPVLDSPIPA